MHVYNRQNGFALPTILITSVVMLIVLVSAIGAASSVRTALDAQYYSQLAREAAESGIIRAVDCLKSNGYTRTWSVSPSFNYLRPGTSCTGASYSSCVSSGNCFLIEEPTYRTSFESSGSTTQGNSQIVRSRGYVQVLRAGTTTIWREYESNATVRVGTSSSTTNVDAIIFGY
jgi:Tfp pilus assembly protein PilV